MARKIKYKAIYRIPGQNPFKPQGITIATKTIEIEDDIPREQVEAWAREAQEGNVFERLDVVE
jgi:hypothetical protein